MNASTISIIYMIALVALSGALSMASRRSGRVLRHKESDTVVAFGMRGQYGAGILVQDSKQMFGTVILMAVVFGGGVGFMLPQEWMITNELTSLGDLVSVDRAAQAVGGIFGAIIAVQLLSWIKEVIGIAILLVIVLVPYRHFYGDAYGHIGIQEKLTNWRLAEISNKLPPQIKDENRSTALTLKKFTGMWTGDNNYKVIEISSSGSLILHSLTGKKTAKSRFYGNGDIVRASWNEGENEMFSTNEMLFRVVDSNTIERVRSQGDRRPVKVISTLHRIDRAQGVK